MDRDVHPSPLEPGLRVTRRAGIKAGVAGAATAWLAQAAGLPAVAEAADAERLELVVPRGRFGADGETSVLRPRTRVQLVGGAAAALHGLGLEVRGRRSGDGWSPWRALHAHAGHAPDEDEGEVEGDLVEPVWLGPADELQLRARRRPARDLRLVLVGVPEEARAVARAASAVPRQAATGAGVPDAPTIVPRAAWGGDGVVPRGAPSYGTVQMAFVHHTVNANDYTAEQAPGVVLAIAKYHRNGNGWSDLGYNFLVDRFGRIYEGRAGGVDRAVVGAQAGGWNSVSTGVAIIGTFEQTAPPAAALEAVARLLAWKLALHGVPVEGSASYVSSGGSANRFPAGRRVTLPRIAGHRDGCTTDCPGGTFYGGLAALRARAASIAPASPLRAELAGPSTPPPYGGRAAFTGRVTNEGAPVAGQSVVVEKEGTSSWVPLAAAVSDADGRFAVEVPWRAEGNVRARWGTVRSPEVDPGIVPVLSLRRGGAASIRRGSRGSWTGTVRGVRKATVEVRRRDAKGRWRPYRSLSASTSGGRLRARIALRSPALYRARIVVRSGGRTTRSREVSIRAR